MSGPDDVADLGGTEVGDTEVGDAVPFDLGAFRERLERVSTPAKVVKVAVRSLVDALDVPTWAHADYDRAEEVWRSLPSGDADDVSASEVEAALAKRQPRDPSTLALALALDVRHRRILALRRPGRGFRGREVAFARRLLERVRLELVERAESRRREVLERSYGQLLRRLRGNDLHYRILHAIRDLLAYDHSAGVFVWDAKDGVHRLQAEQIAWTKGRSKRIGLVADVLEDPSALASIGNSAFLFRRDEEGRWLAQDERALLSPPLSILDDVHGDDERPAPRSALVAPLVFEERCVGILTAFGLFPRSLEAFHALTVRPFLPLAAIAVHNQLQDEGIERALLEEQRKQAISDVARGVAHDVNNALGVLVLRTRIVREEVERAENADVRHVEDLRVIESYASSCRRIFQGLLQFARRGQEVAGDVRLADVLRHILSFKRTILRARGIQLIERIDDVPPVRGQPSAMEQLILNLLQNARQASRPGDKLVLALRRRGGQARLLVGNTAVIPKHVLPRVMEPFFTTRRERHGLGLALCRTIVVEHGGTMRIRTREGSGTLVTVRLPFARREDD